MLQLLRSWNIEQGSFVREILLREFAKVSIENVLYIYIYIYIWLLSCSQKYQSLVIKRIGYLCCLLLNVIHQGLDAYGLATLDSFTSTTMPFSSSRPFNSLTEEDMTNLRTFYRLISLFSGMRGAETVRMSSLRSALWK